MSFLWKTTSFVFLATHSHLVEPLSSSWFDVFHSSHRENCVLRHFTIVSSRAIALSLELESRVARGFFSVQSAVRFGPLHLAGISFHLEVFVAFWSAETKQLWVVAYETNSMSRIYSSWTKPAFLETHLCRLLFLFPRRESEAGLGAVSPVDSQFVSISAQFFQWVNNNGGWLLVGVMFGYRCRDQLAPRIPPPPCQCCEGTG